MSYFTSAEKERLSFELAGLSETIGHANVSQSQLSIARFAGGCTIGGRHFVYFPQHDELWRDDVLSLVHGWRRTDAMAKDLPTMPAQVQGVLL